MNQKLISNSNQVLRKIFDNEKNLDIVQDFLEKILDIKISKIVKKNNIVKKGIINVEVITEEFDKLNIGIQILDGKYIQEKILIYGALMYTDEEDFDSSKNIITINILHTQFFKTEDYHKIITFNEKGLIFHVIELPKFNKTKIKTEKDAWIAYLSTNDVEIHKISKEKNEKIDKLDKEIDNYWKDEIL